MPRDPFSTVQQDAAWAERFKNSTSSLAQRQRYAEQRAAGDVDTAMQEAEDFEVAQLRDPELGRLMLGRQRERRMGFEGEMNRDFRERQLGFQQHRAAQQDALARQKFDLDVEKSDLAERRALREIQDAARIERETDALEQASFDMRQAGMLPGSEGYAAGMTAAAIANPYAKPDLRKAVLSDARVDMDPDELIARAQSSGMKTPKLSMRQGADGRMVFGVSEGSANPTQETGKVFESFDALKAAFPQGGIQFDLMPDGKVRAKGGSLGAPKEDKLGTMMGGGQSPAAAAAPPRIKVNPQTGERIILKDGAWQPLP